MNEKNSVVDTRFSYQKPEVTQLPNEGYGDWGGPMGASAGFMATGTNMTYSTARTGLHTFSNTLIMEVRGGISYYHNDRRRTRPTARIWRTQLGINGMNIDEWTSGPRRRFASTTGSRNPMMGYVNSLPWDRWERSWEFATTFTKVRGNHTFKFGGNYRHNSDKLLQTQDTTRARAAGSPSAARRPARRPTRPPTAASPTRSPRSCSTCPGGYGRDLKVLEDVGSQHWAVYTFVQDKWQVSQEADRRPRPALRVLRRRFIGLAGKGIAVELQPGRRTPCSSRATATSPTTSGSRSDFNNFNPRLGASYRINDKTVMRAGFGASTTPFPDNRYAFNYPVKQNNSYQAPNSYSAQPTTWRPASRRRSTSAIPDNGIERRPARRC